MKKRFKSFLIESGESPADVYLNDYIEHTHEHPFNPRVRLHGPVAVHLSKSGPAQVHLHDILALEPGQGDASLTLQGLTDLADEYGVTIEGISKAYSDKDGHIKSTKRLNAWYKKHGFEIGSGSEDDGYDIVYRPKGTT